MYKSFLKSLLSAETSRRRPSFISLFFQEKQGDQPDHDLLGCAWPEQLYRKVLLLLMGILTVIVLLMKVT